MAKYKKNESGNLGGRPPKSRMPKSPFDIIMNRKFTWSMDGKSGEMGVEEALLRKTFAAAMAGKRTAVREILKLIKKHDQAKAAKFKPTGNGELLFDTAPIDDINQELALLDITRLDNRIDRSELTEDRWLVENWAFEEFFKRRRSLVRLDAKTIQDIKGEIRHFAVDPAALIFPKRFG